MPQYRDASTSKKKVDLVGHLIMEKRGLFRKKKLTFVVHQALLAYLENLDDTTQNEVRNELAQQAMERYQMLNDPQDPYYGDEDGFEHYRSVKYKLLCQHIATMLAIGPDPIGLKI